MNKNNQTNTQNVLIASNAQITKFLQRKKDRNSQYKNLLSYIIEILSSEKSETEKANALILLEENAKILQERSQIITLFKIFEDNIHQTTFTCSDILKSQILLTGTTLLILLNMKEQLSEIFIGFIDSILIELLKDVNNRENSFLRQIACKCLEEIEIEYRGILFCLMGRRTLDIFDYKEPSNNSDTKSIKSLSISINSRKIALLNSKSVISGNEFKRLEYKTIELGNDGILILVEREMTYVFQCYLELYSEILKDLITFEVMMTNVVNGEEFKQFTVQNELKGDIRNDNNNSQYNYNKYFEFLGIKNLIEVKGKGGNENEEGSIILPFNDNKNISNEVLHLKGTIYENYIILFESFHWLNRNNIYSNDNKVILSQSILSYTYKSISQIINLLPKVDEMTKVKIWKNLSLIIPYIELNQSALLPHFKFFHLNSSSYILTHITIQIIQTFKFPLSEKFLLKLILKLCLLIKDSRINTNIRILIIRWLINLRKSTSIKFNFDQYLQTISYYLTPSPFEDIKLFKEKLKGLLIFFNKSKHTDYINQYKSLKNSMTLLNPFKYYPIFSDCVKTLFTSYLIIIINYPYKEVIDDICQSIKDILREIPRLLPNVISLTRSINILSLNETEVYKDNISLKEIYQDILIEMSNFLAVIYPYRKLNGYYELFLEIAKNKNIKPSNIINGLKHLYQGIKDERNWKIERNIINVIKTLLHYHDIEILLKNKLEELIDEMAKNSFDYGIREKAKMYYALITHIEKPIILRYLAQQSDINSFEIKLEYDYHDYGSELIGAISIEQTNDERKAFNINDRGTAVFDNDNANDNNTLLLSVCNKDLQGEYNEYILTDCNKNINIDKLNDYLNKIELSEVIRNVIETSDILRLFIKDEHIDDMKESNQISKEMIFTTISSNKKDNDVLSKGTILENYIDLVLNTHFYIKLPMNISIKKPFINTIYCVSLCFGSISSLDIISPILLPCLSYCKEKKETFPYIYKIILIIYPKLPIPSEVRAKVLFYDSKGKCCTGLLNNINVQFEDFFLPVVLPEKYLNDKISILNEIYKCFWKKFKQQRELYINTIKCIEIKKDLMVKKVKEKLSPFLIDEDFQKYTYVIENPYIKYTNDSKDENVIVKKNYDEKTNCYTSNKYDFLMDYYLESNYEKKSNLNGITLGKYILAHILIFVPEKYHILFKIKISDFSSIIEIRSDCPSILEYLDDYFNSWY